mmetsp:Transcript_57522/g.115483  ORF Transcript_57522/g.115483 Transcript_57522/m.115483 type:complete len:261 (-) Transcript_57522:342-1124(-)
MCAETLMIGHLWSLLMLLVLLLVLLHWRRRHLTERRNTVTAAVTATAAGASSPSFRGAACRPRAFRCSIEKEGCERAGAATTTASGLACPLSTSNSTAAPLAIPHAMTAVSTCSANELSAVVNDTATSTTESAGSSRRSGGSSSNGSTHRTGDLGGKLSEELFGVDGELRPNGAAHHALADCARVHALSKKRVHVRPRELPPHEPLKAVDVEVALDRRDLGRLELVLRQHLAQKRRLVVNDEPAAVGEPVQNPLPRLGGD